MLKGNSTSTSGCETLDWGAYRVTLSWHTKLGLVVDMTAAIFDLSDQHLISASTRVTLPDSASVATDTALAEWLSTAKDSLRGMAWHLLKNLKPTKPPSITALTT